MLSVKLKLIILNRLRYFPHKKCRFGERMKCLFVPAQDEVSREAFDMKVLPKTLSMLKPPHVIGTGVAQ